MMSFKTPLGLLLLAMLAESSSGKENGPYKYNLSNKSDLNKLYNSKVYMAELYTRLLFVFSMGSLSGVRVTLEDGSKWLIYKGIGTQTGIVDGSQMDGIWKLKERKNLRGSKTVYDFVKAGAGDFKL